MKPLYLAIAVAAAIGLAAPVQAGETPSPSGAKVYFVNLNDGDTVTSPVRVVFGLSGMGVAPAGTEKDKTGHHHIFLNRAPLGEGPDGAEELDFNIPADENHIHFGRWPDGGRAGSADRQPHAATGSGRHEPHTARSAGCVATDHDHR